jgi:hypothetical protein
MASEIADESWMQAVERSIGTGGQGKLAIRFELFPVENRLKSWGGEIEEEYEDNGLLRTRRVKVKGAGRPIFDEVEYIEIVIPGDKSTVVHRAVQDKDRKQFAQQYAAWKAGNQEAASGTPIKMVPWLNTAQVRELEYFGCKTLEQLADLSDANYKNIGAVLELRQKARDAIAQAGKGAPIAAMREELKKRDAQIEALQAQVSQLVAMKDPNRAPAAPTPKRKRKRSAAAEETV